MTRRRRSTASSAVMAPVEALTGAVGAAASDGRLMNPWLMWLGSPALPTVSHAMFGPNPLVAVGWTAAGAALTATSWSYGSSRSNKTRTHAAVTTGAAGLWTAVASITWPWEPATGAAWLIAGTTLALSWNIKRGLRNDNGGRGAGGNGLAEILAKAGLEGATADRVAIGPNRATIDVTLPRGEMVADDAVQAAGKLASIAGLPKTQVRALPSSTDNGKAQFVFTTRDALRNPPAYRGPSAPGETLLVPLCVGSYEDGSPQLIYLMNGSGSNIVHLLIFGMPGAGKTGGGRAALAEIITRTEVVLWGVDVTKAGQGIGPFEDAFDWLITGEDAASMDEAEEMAFEMFDCLEDVVAARTRFLAARGLDGWRPGCGLPVLVVWVEEAGRLLEEAKKFTAFVNAARSAGVVVVVSLQRPTTDGIPGTLRAALGGLWSFGLNTDDDATRFLGSELVEKGVHPDVWKNQYPGRNYLIAPGIAPELHITPAQAEGYYADSDHGATRIREHVAAYAQVRVALDEPSYNAAPQAYRDYRAKRAAKAGVTLPAGSAGGAASSPTSKTTDSDRELERAMAQLPPEARRSLADAMPSYVPEDADEAEVLEMAAALAGGGEDLPEAEVIGGAVEDLEFEEMTRADVDVFLRACLASAWDKGTRRLRAADLAEMFRPTGRSRQTMYDFLKPLTKAGVLRQRDRGVWELARRPEVPEDVEIELVTA